jgi:hypothetical protein
VPSPDKEVRRGLTRDSSAPVEQWERRGGASVQFLQILVSSCEGVGTRPLRRRGGCGRAPQSGGDGAGAAWSCEGENLAGAALAVFKGETRAAVGPNEVGWHAHTTRLPPDVSDDLMLMWHAQGVGEDAGGPARLQQPVLNFF